MAIIGNQITKAKVLLDEGELVAIPTETVYGLAANAFDVNAVLKIYEVKNRPKFNPLILHSNSLSRFEEWGIVITPQLQKLADHFSPGPLTYVVQKSSQIPDIISAGQDSVALRIPNHKRALELLAALDYPLAAPSANPSEYVSPTTAFHVQEQLGDKIPYILDGGSCEIGVESTIVDLRFPKVRLLRLGGISKEEIEEVLGEEIEDLLVSDNIIAPGMMKRHYATAHPIIFEENREEIAITENTFALRFKSYADYLPKENQFLLSPEGNINEAAANLFSTMRKMDAMEMDLIIVEHFPTIGIGRAINDRLERAASKNLHAK
jgi:L-threonylcarbamoyladenylate synthase